MFCEMAVLWVFKKSWRSHLWQIIFKRVAENSSWILKIRRPYSKYLLRIFFEFFPSSFSIHDGLMMNKNSSWYMYTNRRKKSEVAQQKQHIKWANKNILKGNNRNTRKKCEICSKLLIKTSQRRKGRHSDYFLLILDRLDVIF